MSFNMHCRSTSLRNSITDSSSFLFVRSSDGTIRPSCADRVPTPAPTTRQRHRRRRRLEDPIITYASNYYVTYSHPTLRSPPPSPQSPSHLARRRCSSKSALCDLYNLLECPPSAKQRRKLLANEVKARPFSCRAFFRRIAANYLCVATHDIDAPIAK